MMDLRTRSIATQEIPDSRYIQEVLETRQIILEAAAQLSSEGGPAAITIAGVAEKAGLTKGAIFHYFKNKDALVHGLLTFVAERFESEVAERALTSSFASALVSVTFETAIDNPELLRALFSSVLLDPSLAELVNERSAAWHERLLQEGWSDQEAKVLRSSLDGLLLAVTVGLNGDSTTMFNSLQLALHDVFPRLVSSASDRCRSNNESSDLPYEPY